MTETDLSIPLPDDPDTDVAETPSGQPKPVHLQPEFAALVFVGGALGVAAREGLILAIPDLGAVPLAILVINLTGALLLGLLLEGLSRRGPDRGRRRAARLLVGTGFMGGFTTYSAPAADSAALIGAGSVGVGIAYALVTVIVGACATWAGILLGIVIRRARKANR
ncbi:MAG: CrcB family protein [Microbacterium sp.]